MISYPRWKIALVAIVMLFGIAGAAEPVRRGKRAAARRDRAAVQAGDRTAVEQLLKDKGVTPTGAFLDQGRLTLRFASKTGPAEGARPDLRCAPE